MACSRLTGRGRPAAGRRPILSASLDPLEVARTWVKGFVQAGREEGLTHFCPRIVCSPVPPSLVVAVPTAEIIIWAN